MASLEDLDPVTQSIMEWEEKQLAAGHSAELLFGTVAAELILLGTARGFSPEQSIARLVQLVEKCRKKQL